MSCILSSVPVMLMSNFRTNVLEAVQVFGFPFFVIFVNWLSFRLHNLFMKSCLLTLAHLMASRISQLADIFVSELHPTESYSCILQFSFPFLGV